jgi:sugar/nucleoside kinase (ribokinase family)
MVSTVAIVGNVNVDLIIRPVRELPPPGTERIVERVEMRVGGAAATTALALAKLGSSPRLTSRVGDDILGGWLRRELERGGVLPEVQTVEGTATGVSIAFEAPARDRSFLTDLGSLRAIDASMVPEEALASDFVLFCGYFLLPALRGLPTEELMGRAHTAGATVLLDTGWDPAGWTPQTRTEITSILPSVDIFLPNDVEAQAIAAVEETTVAARALQAVSGGWVVVKCGAAVGAGDAFNAGLVYGLSTGRDLGEALRLAVRLGSTIVSRRSADRFPGIEDISGD